MPFAAEVKPAGQPALRNIGVESMETRLTDAEQTKPEQSRADQSHYFGCRARYTFSTGAERRACAATKQPPSRRRIARLSLSIDLEELGSAQPVCGVKRRAFVRRAFSCSSAVWKPVKMETGVKRMGASTRPPARPGPIQTDIL